MKADTMKGGQGSNDGPHPDGTLGYPKQQQQQPNQHQHQPPNVVLSGEFLPATFRSQSISVARDVVYYVCRRDDCLPPSSKTALIMRSLVDDTLKNRLDLMGALVARLDVRGREQFELIDSITTYLFDDQVVSWSRIVTLHAFCGYLAKYCEQRNIPDCADDVGRVLGNIVINRLGLWIVVNGGWAALERHFPVMGTWDSGGLWKAITILALLVGAVLAFYSSVRFMNNAS